MSQTVKTHKLAVTAILSAAAAILMFLSFPMPFLIPSFVKMDFSELPALLAAFSLGPVSGRGGVPGEERHQRVLLHHRRRGRAVQLPAGGLPGRARGAHLQGQTHPGRGPGRGPARIRGHGGVQRPHQLLHLLPFYTSFMPLDTIIGMYQDLIPSVDGLLACLVIFNAPFTLLKGLLDTLLAFLIYKPLSPLLHR